jgi:hypothetical protein
VHGAGEGLPRRHPAGELCGPGGSDLVVLARRPGGRRDEPGAEQPPALQPAEGRIDRALVQVGQAELLQPEDKRVAVVLGVGDQAQQQQGEHPLEHLRVVAGHRSSM